jgi:hypothetical protein
MNKNKAEKSIDKKFISIFEAFAKELEQMQSDIEWLKQKNYKHLKEIRKIQKKIM